MDGNRVGVSTAAALEGLIILSVTARLDDRQDHHVMTQRARHMWRDARW
jgi:hypothetical protein